MEKEKVLLVIHPKAKRYVADVLPILDERWETSSQVTSYAGHGIELTVNALQQDYRWIIAFGGDGTLNEVVNGAMQAQQQCTVGVLPGGTVNQWGHEIGLPAHPIEAAHVLTTSIPHSIDIGFIGVQALTFSDEVFSQAETQGKLNARHHFIIIAGLGVDAVTIQTTTESFKQHYGQLAFMLDWLQILPSIRPFPAQIDWSNNQSWRGQPWDILVSNTRRYANVTNLIPKAHVNDGLLDIRIFSLFSPEPGLLHPFQDHAFSVRLPASVALELDGSGMPLTDYLSAENRERLLQVTDLSKIMITYKFTCKPAALSMAIPKEYSGGLFKATF
ncbi:MAG: hypothetical protein NVS4B1_04190 [Ktedonobacteraceae bacterium]